MIPTIADKRPPYVRFEEREMGLNEVETKAQGRPIPRIVALALITPHGSKDVVEKIADTWLEQIHKQALAGSYPLEWVNFFKAQYEEWKKGNELPREGEPVQTWPQASSEQRRRLKAIGLTTVEDLAEVPDSDLNSIGLDGRYLRDLARSWLNNARDKGANVKELADAQARIRDLEQTVERQGQQISNLTARLTEGEPEAPRRGPGRPRKDEAA